MKHLLRCAAACWLAIASPGRSGPVPEPQRLPGGDTLVGVSVPSRIAAVAAEVPGTIAAMTALEGERVVTGQTLFRLGSRLQELDVARLEVMVNSGVLSDRARASLDWVKTEIGRLRELKASEIASQSDLEKAQLQSELAQVNVREAELARELSGIELAQAKERVAQRTLKSPLDGIVTRWFKQVGECTEQLVPVIEVMSLHPLWVEFECPVAKERDYRKGSTVQVVPAIGDHAPRAATIVYVSMRATPSSHTFLVRAAVPNADYSWRAGLKMTVDPVDGGVDARPGAVPPGK
ncbi:MAG TPA: efflux RND transporter periplasmic adaptor subunit [Planctomycetota bacterium]|nr:efflux RND transporter periplasmic adaptor subunit [Planctomycetota bacterium]